jgi:hypothetical protein
LRYASSLCACQVMDKCRREPQAHCQGLFGSMTSIRPTAQKTTSILVSLARILSVISHLLQAAGGPNGGGGGVARVARVVRTLSAHCSLF